MDEGGIKRIEALASSGELKRFDVPAFVLPPGCGVESIEHLLNQPTRMRRTFKTQRLPDFCNYVTGNAPEDEQTAIFVEPDGSGAKGVLDYGRHSDPRWGDHKAVLSMVHTAEFAAVEKICGRGLTQREVTDWIEDWRHMIRPMIEGDEDTSSTDVSIGRAVASIRKIDLKAQVDSGHEDGDFRASRTSMEQVEASSNGGKIPGLFRIRCRVYPETQARDLDLRLSVLTGADKPRLSFRLVGREALLEAIAEEVELDLTERLQGHRVFVGSV